MKKLSVCAMAAVVFSLMCVASANCADTVPTNQNNSKTIPASPAKKFTSPAQKAADKQAIYGATIKANVRDQAGNTAKNQRVLSAYIIPNDADQARKGGTAYIKINYADGTVVRVQLKNKLSEIKSAKVLTDKSGKAYAQVTLKSGEKVTCSLEGKRTKEFTPPTHYAGSHRSSHNNSHSKGSGNGSSSHISIPSNFLSSSVNSSSLLKKPVNQAPGMYTSTYIPPKKKSVWWNPFTW